MATLRFCAVLEPSLLSIYYFINFLFYSLFYRLDGQPPASMEELCGRLPGRELPVDDHLSRCRTAGCRYYGL